MITPLYAALLIFLFVALSLRTIKLRRAAKKALGVDDDVPLARAVRVHSNFAEYVPMALIGLYLAESQGLPALMLHGLGLSLLVSRVIHAYGLSQTDEDFRFRVSGMFITLSVLIVLGVSLLWLGFTA